MPLTIPHPATRAAVAAATNQTAQLAALIAEWAGGVVHVKSYSGATLRDTGVYAAWVLDALDPRGMTLGPLATRSISNGLLSIDRTDYCLADGTVIFSLDGADTPLAVGLIATSHTNFADGVATKMRVVANAGLPLSATPAWLVGADVLEWIEIPNTALSSVAPSPTPAGSTGPSSKISAWCGACLKIEGSVYMLGAAGGHNDYAGNEVNVLALNTNTPAWVQHCAPSADADVIQAQYNLDLKPGATHTYCMTQFINSQNRMIVFRGTGGPTIGPAAPDGWAYTSNTRNYTYDYGGAAWEGPDATAPFPGSMGDMTACMIVTHPVTGDTYCMAGADGFQKWTAATNAISKISNETRGTWYTGQALDYTRDRILYMGGFAGTEGPGVFGLAGAGIAVTFGGLGASVLTVGGYPGVAYDPENDCFWTMANHASGTVKLHKVTAADWVVSEPTTAGTAPANRPNGIHNAVQYVPELKGVVLANSYSGNVKFIRTA